MYIKKNPHDKEKINDHTKIVVTGGTGLIGEALVAQLVANGDSVSVLTRDASKARKILPLDLAVFQWNPESDNPPLECLEGSDAIVNLIGEPIPGIVENSTERGRVPITTLCAGPLPMLVMMSNVNQTKARVLIAIAPGESLHVS